MFYPAIVLDNNSFPSTGKIRVRIQKEYSNSINDLNWDLVNKPSFIAEGNEDPLLAYNQDFDVYVFTPFGGGENSGMFALPRVNTKGLVTKMGGPNSTEYIWVGSYFESSLGRLNIPSDKIYDTFKTGAAYGSYTLDDQNDIVLRTKSLNIPTTWKPTDSTDSFNWKKQKTDNIVSLGRYKIKITKIDYVDSSLTPKIYEDVYIGEETKYKEDGSIDKVERKFQIQCVDTKVVANKQLFSEYKQMADSFSLYVYNENTQKVTSIAFDNTGVITIKANKGSDISAEIKVSSTDIILTDGNTSVNITKDKVSLKADKEIALDANSISIGGGEKKVVCSNSDLVSFKTLDGLILSTSTKIKVG